MDEFDVIVVGAGPTGATLAIDLGQRGVRTLLVEKETTTKHWPKFDRSNARTMEIYRRLGFADRVRELGYPAEASMDVFVVTRLVDPPLARLEYPSVAEHREKIAATVDGSEPLEPYQLVSQNDVEPLLKEIAEGTANVTVRFGCELVTFDQDPDGVSCLLRGADGVEQTVRASYLAGCDGASSQVRKTLGIKLEGSGSIAQIQQVTFESDELYDRIPIGKGRHYYLADEAGASFVVQGSRRVFTMNSMLPPDADFEAEIRRRVGFDFDFKILGALPWKLHLLLAERYREGRVFLAGDAVRLVIPNGGLGMNTGVGDAIDLSWKLAGTVQGWGGPGLLDSYEPERRRVGAANVAASRWASDGYMTWRSLANDRVLEQSEYGEQLRAEIAASAAVNQRRVHDMVGVELGYTYAGSQMVAYEPDNVTEWDRIKYLPHTRPGVRIPHMWLKDGRAMQDVLGQNFTLIDLTGSADASALVEQFNKLGIPLDVFSSDEPQVRKVYERSLLLVRPDLHVFWRGDALPQNIEELALAAGGCANSEFKPVYSQAS